VSLFCALLPRFIFLNTNENEVGTQKYFASLLSPSAFAMGADIITSYEYAGVGVQWSNMYDGTYSFGSVLQMLVVDIVLYAIMAWYNYIDIHTIAYIEMT